MAFSTSKFHTNTARGAQSRGAVELANAALAYSLSRILTSGATARGTTAAKAKTVATVAFTVAGQHYSLAATDDFWTLSGTVVPASSFQKYALLVDTAGVMSIQEATSNIVSLATVVWTNVSGLSPWAPFLTIVGSTKAIVAVLSISTDSTHTFTPGTTALNAAGITAAFVDGIDQSLLPLIANEPGTIVGNGG